MSPRLKALALILAILLALPLILVQATPATAQVKGPAVDRVEWIRVPIPDVPAALETGRIDLYIFGRLPGPMAERLAATPGIRIVTAAAGLTDIVLNPAPVQILKFPGRETRETAALKLGVNPLLIRYVKFIEDEGKTEVELCGVVDVPGGVEEVFRAEKANFNPFCIREVRFELQYAFDRERIQRETYRGFAIIKYTFYGPDDPTYADIAEVIAKYAFEYNFERAKRNIEDIMRSVGADLIGGKWHYRGQRVDIIGIIRVEDERLEIGRSLALELVKLGFNVIPSELTFGPAIGIVYGTNPIDFQWHFYTEGWGKAVLDRYDAGNLAQFGADIIGYLPGWGELEYWNYRHELTIDGRNASDYARDAYYMNVKSKEEWLEALRRGTDLAVRESIRIWGFATLDKWPVRAEVQGLTVDLGAGLRSPYNCRGWFVPGRNDIKVGHLWVWTATTAWNTFRGFRDVYSVDPARCTYDFVVWRHPFTGMPIPFRVSFTVETAGPDGKLSVPDDALWFDAEKDTWVYAKELGRTEAVSKVVFDMSRFLGTKWHNGQTITWADLLGSLAIYLDAVYDPEKSVIERAFTALNREGFDTVVAIRPVGNNLEVYINFWHFERAYIADWATWATATTIPFELVVAQFYAGYIAKEFALDLARSSAENLPWLSLVMRPHAEKIAGYFRDGKIRFEDFRSYVTAPAGPLMTPDEWGDRVGALLSWFDRYGTVWVSNGPYMLTYFSSEEQRLVLEAFRDPTYPFGPRDWVFGEATPVSIREVVAPLVPVGGSAKVVVRAEGPGVITVKYIIRDPVTRDVIASGVASPTAEGFVVELPEALTNRLNPFTVYELLVIAYSTEVTLPTEVIARLQTIPAPLVEEIGGIAESVTKLSEDLAGIQADLLRRMEDLRGTLSAELAESVGVLTEAMTKSISDLGRATSDAITALGRGVETRFASTDAKITAVEDRITDVERKLSTDIQTVRESADAAQSNARLALIVSIINLLVLIGIAAMIFTRR
jgi:peptide/nickel transport system substrate-binding protein